MLRLDHVVHVTRDLDETATRMIQEEFGLD
jgi:hypothetical protein